MTCKQTKTEFEHHRYMYRTEKAVEEYKKSFEEAKKGGGQIDAKKLSKLLPYTAISIGEVKKNLEESKMNPDKFLKPQEDEESFLIKLKLDSEENIEFLNKMRTKQFPKEITAVEISGFNVNFIKEK